MSGVAFAGLALARQRPKTVAAWAVLYLVLSVISFGLIFGLFGSSYMQLLSVSANGGTAEVAEIERQARASSGLLVLVLPLSLAMGSVMLAAVYRAVLRPSDSGAFYLRFGGDELRLVGLLIVVWLIFAAVAIGGFGLSALLGGLFTVVGFIATLCAVVFLGVRLSLIFPATFAARRFRWAEAWRLSKGRFWPLFGAYALATAITFIVILVIQFVLGLTLAQTMASFGPALSRMVAARDFGGMIAGFGGAGAVYLLVSTALALFQLLMLIAPAAAAYRQLASDADTTAETFA